MDSVYLHALIIHVLSSSIAFFQTDDTTLKCIHPTCTMVSHIMCLSKKFLSESKGQIIPVDGKCPRCRMPVLWADLVRLKKGCYQNLVEVRGDSSYS